MMRRIEHHGWIPGTRLALSALAAGTVLLSVVTMARSQDAPGYAILYTFTGGADGGRPEAGLVRDAADNLYGTTYYGGVSDNGVVFRIDPTGNETVLYSFTGGADGANPSAGLIRDSVGNLDGTNDLVVFKLDAADNLTVLYTFTGGADGKGPTGRLVRDAAGNLYGMTSQGGIANNGVVFKLDSSNKETVLYSFTGGADGWEPVGGLVRDTAGNLYGCTHNDGGSGAGVVFKVDPAGKETVLHSFTGAGDGAYPEAGLVRDALGNLYGTTNFGPSFGGSGVVFKLDTNTIRNYTLLYSFMGGTDGINPKASLVRDAAGNLYGTASNRGGCGSCGSVFKVDPTGKETVLHTFSGTDGSYPRADVILDSAGDLYGTTSKGGTFLSGVVFKLTFH